MEQSHSSRYALPTVCLSLFLVLFLGWYRKVMTIIVFFNIMIFYSPILAVLIWISTCHEAAIIQASLWISIYWMHNGLGKWLHTGTWSILFFPSFSFLILPSVLYIIESELRSNSNCCLDQLGDFLGCGIPDLNADEVSHWSIHVSVLSFVFFFGIGIMCVNFIEEKYASIVGITYPVVIRNIT